MIRAEGVGKTFRPAASVRRLLYERSFRGREVVALDGVDLAVARGEALGLMGANGAGKSTLLRLFAGLLAPSSGRVSICGLDASRGSPELARKVGYVCADERGLTPHLSPREHLAFFGALYGLARAPALARADELIGQIGLTAEAHRPLRELSTGQRRRTALARGLVGAPPVLLLDEPTRGLDPLGASVLHAHLLRALTLGAAVVIATHDIAEAHALCGQVAVLEAGRLAALGPPALAAARLVGARA